MASNYTWKRDKGCKVVGRERGKGERIDRREIRKLKARRDRDTERERDMEERKKREKNEGRRGREVH